MKQSMTLKEMEALPREFLWSKEVAPAIGMDESLFRFQVRDDKKKGKHTFDFPIIVRKNRITIPKAAFLKYMRGR
jgi:hypothetical protein